MTDFISLSIDLQMMLFAGYVAHVVSDIGRGTNRGAEDVVFRVFGFGVVLIVFWSAFKSFVIAIHAPAAFWVPAGGQDAVKVVLFVAGGVVLGAIWRKLGRSALSRLMSKTRVYQDDHSPTMWTSVLAKDTGWHYVRVKTTGGMMFICNMHDLPDGLPLKPVTINHDGIAMYATQRKPADEEAVELDVQYGDQGHARLMVFPIDSIQHVEIGWR